MKHIYSAPSIEVVAFSTEDNMLLTVSGGSTTPDPNPSGFGGMGGDNGNYGGDLSNSRFDSDWDDED